MVLISTAYQQILSTIVINPQNCLVIRLIHENFKYLQVPMLITVKYLLQNNDIQNDINFLTAEFADKQTTY
ncbi:MAG: hypothetical protein BWX63_02207 [Bacteroidetes bacterium ADurb.Bin041]|nr:MAG: hypothetical protein BWX63_02207 [Bacteroidetes bacterium ADurb.Bin041]